MGGLTEHFKSDLIQIFAPAADTGGEEIEAFVQISIRKLITQQNSLY